MLQERSDVREFGVKKLLHRALRLIMLQSGSIEVLMPASMIITYSNFDQIHLPNPPVGGYLTPSHRLSVHSQPPKTDDFVSGFCLHLVGLHALLTLHGYEGDLLPFL